MARGNTMIHTLSFEMPAAYMPPLGTPLYWRDEVTGVLGAAIMAYLSHAGEPENFPAPTEDQLALVISYLRYVINAPCWRDGTSTGRLATLRERAKTITTVEEVMAFIWDCLKIGLDPL